jgi:hypothetical protein
MADSPMDRAYASVARLRGQAPIGATTWRATARTLAWLAGDARTIVPAMAIDFPAGGGTATVQLIRRAGVRRQRWRARALGTVSPGALAIGGTPIGAPLVSPLNGVDGYGSMIRSALGSYGYATASVNGSGGQGGAFRVQLGAEELRVDAVSAEGEIVPGGPILDTSQVEAITDAAEDTTLGIRTYASMAWVPALAPSISSGSWTEVPGTRIPVTPRRLGSQIDARAIVSTDGLGEVRAVNTAGVGDDASGAGTHVLSTYDTIVESVSGTGRSGPEFIWLEARAAGDPVVVESVVYSDPV